MRFIFFCLFYGLLSSIIYADGLLVVVGDDIHSHCYDSITNYVTHKTAAGWSVHVMTRSDAFAAAPPESRPELYDSPLTTNDPADRIKAAIRSICETGSYSYLLLIGNPDPLDITKTSDDVGDIPMKMTYAVGTASWATASIWYVPSDCFYRDLDTDWDKNDNGLFAEWNGDHGAGGLSLADCELSVGRIPCYGTEDYDDVRAILNKSIWYMEDAPTNYCEWRYTAFQPNPIDWSDNYGAEGNVSPIYMAEDVRTNYFTPNGIESTRVYEDSYDYSPWNYDPPEVIPQPRELLLFTRYYSWRLFKALFNGTSDNYLDYTNGIAVFTDDDYSTADTRDWAPGNWMQFRLAYNNNADYAPVQFELYAPTAVSFPGKLRIRMSASGNNWSDAATLVEDNNVISHVDWDSASGQYKVTYSVTAGSLTRYGKRKYIRLEYTGSSTQEVTLSEFKGYVWEHKRIRHDVTNLWFNQGYGLVVFTTHGSHSGASDIIYNYETDNLRNDQPGMIFMKACQTAWAEDENNLSYALLKNGAIGVIAATRTSWGYSEHGHVMFFKHVVTNMPYGAALRRVNEELESVNYYGWDGNYSDVFRFNLYGDPTLALNAIYPELIAVDIYGETVTTATCSLVDLTCEIRENEIPVTEIRTAPSRAALETSTWHPFSEPYPNQLPPDFETWHSVYVQVRNQGKLRSDIHSVSIYLVPEPVSGLLFIGICGIILALRKGNNR